MTGDQARGIYGTAIRLGLSKTKAFELAQSGNFKKSFNYLWRLIQKKEANGTDETYG